MSQFACHATPHGRYVGLWVLLVFLQTPTLFAQTKATTPTARRVVQEVGIDQHLNQAVPLNLQFRDEQGRQVQLADYVHNKPVILTLVYYQCPMLCTQVLNGVLESSQAISLELSRDYDIVSISIDPQETPAMAATKKKRYADNYHRPGAEAGWHFLTGDRAAIEQLAETVGFRYVYDPLTKQYAHASGIIVLTPEGRISRYFYGIDYPPNDLRLGLVEASQNRIGTLADQFLLLCYHYDPATGRYGFVIERSIRAAGSVMATLLGTFLWMMYRRERRTTAETPPLLMGAAVGSDGEEWT